MKIDLLQFPKIKRKLGTRTEAHREIARRFDREFFDGKRDTGYGGYKQDGRWDAVALRMTLHYGLKPGARVLDIGCAKGYLVQALRQRGIEAYGIDVSAYAISEAPEQIKPLLLCADARELVSWVPSAFDLIISINTLHNLPQGEFERVLRHLSHYTVSQRQYITLDSYTNDEEHDAMMAWNLTAQTILSEDEWLALFGRVGYKGDYDWFIP
jgi:2-polyprenyl-3-methyl-5-hydroxy-6-metoxy-1,4-benzoquinol methylase